MPITKTIQPKYPIRYKSFSGLIFVIIILLVSPLDACRLWATISLPGYTLFDSDNNLDSTIREELTEFQLHGLTIIITAGPWSITQIQLFMNPTN